MKRLVALTLSLVMMFAMFAGCAKEEATTTTAAPAGETTTAAGETTTAAPENIRTDIIFANTADVSSLDPHDQTDVYSAAICDMIYGKLFYFDNETNLLPGLCKEWTIVSDTEYELKLEEGVKFHNGDEMKAEDVKFSIERMIEKPKTAALYDKIDSVTVVDDYTINFTTSEPMSPILLNLAGPQACIVNKKVVEEIEAAGNKYGEEPIGTGPMKLKEWAINDHITVERFEDYYKGAVVASTITMRVIPEAASQTIALETGEIDFIASVAAIDTERVLANDKLKTEQMTGTSISYLGINHKKAPFDNKALRQAIAYGINKQDIIDICYEGYAIPVNSVFQVMMPSHDPDLNPYPYDVEKAKAKMAEAGYPDGGVTFEIGVSSNTMDKVATVIQSQLAEIGIEVTIRMQEFGAFLSYLNGTEHEGFLLGWSNCYNPDRTMSLMFHSESEPASGNRGYYSNPEADKLIEAAKAEMDWAKREPMYKELQKIITEDVAWVPLLQTQSYAGMNKNLMDAKVSKLTPFHDFTNAYVIED